jgi:hypothetical protein
MPKAAQYYFSQSTDGRFAVQLHEPYPGGVTVAWMPSGDYGGKGHEFVMPIDLFEAAIDKFVLDRAAVEPSKDAAPDAPAPPPWEGARHASVLKAARPPKQK